MDKAYNQDTSDFAITSRAPSKGKIELTIPRTDHLNIKTSSAAGEYFRGYYIYRNNLSPYDEFQLYGIDAYSETDTVLKNHQTYKEYVGASSVTDVLSTDAGKGPGIYTDKSCTPNQYYYYRVIVVYRKWNGSAWENSLLEKATSSWTAEFCPDDLLTPY